MANITRKKFIGQATVLGTSLMFLDSCSWVSSDGSTLDKVSIRSIEQGEDVFSYMKKIKKGFDTTFYRQIIGAANEFKEGDDTLDLTADNEASRLNARALIGNTKISDLNEHALYRDGIYDLIQTSTNRDANVEDLTINELKEILLTEPEEKIKKIMPALTSDVIACVVKLMNNDELIQVGQKVFNPLPNSKIGSKGYMSARVQPNSPTDNIEDIVWQVFNAWSFAVGDLVLGTNPVSSDPQSVAKIEAALFDVITTFNLEDTIPNCVLSHIDIQAEVEELNPGTTGIWFQSLAGTEKANQTFDVTIDKMLSHTARRDGKYGLYAETGQGADFTNGHGEGFDMVVHESRKYGFLRALKQKLNNKDAWVHVNDVAGFIGPEVFKTKEQLVRCCLEDTAMGKLHGLPIGLDICSTLHMDITLDDLDWCIEQIMPANPAYLMALPTKNDPMLSYLTTAFNNHVKIREQFGYKVNDDMWNFFKQLEVIDEKGQPTKYFGDPVHVYYKYRIAKGDKRDKATIHKEGNDIINRINKRGVPIARGYGKNVWDLEPELDKQVRVLYNDAKESLWTEMKGEFVASLPTAIPIITTSKNRKDYVYHPETGEELSTDALSTLNNIRDNWQGNSPDIQIIISDGLNVRALTDEGHLLPFLDTLKKGLKDKRYVVNDDNIVITHGRVRAGYACGEKLFGRKATNNSYKAIVHIIGERPGSGHHNFSAYITATTEDVWSKEGKVDHDISRVVSGISDTALTPKEAAKNTVEIIGELFPKTA